MSIRKEHGTLILVPSQIEASYGGYITYDGSAHTFVEANPQKQREMAYWYAYVLSASGLPYMFTHKEISGEGAFQPLYTTVVEPLSATTRMLHAHKRRSKLKK